MSEINPEIRFIIIIASLLVLLIALGVVELVLHRRRLKSIRWRIHVNGTRGKSSVTRLIAAGLRAGNIRTCAKTTGTLPRMIMPDGREFPVFRPGRTNIIEQRRIIKTASILGVEALVIECMALHPALQAISEFKIVRATHGVITNARADHLDVMGPDEEDVARALAATIPPHQKFFTAEQRHLDFFKKVSRDRKTTICSISQEDIAAITDEEMRKFSYIEHRDNVALALKVCEDFGVDRNLALKGMQEAEPDPGALIDFELNFFGRKISFFNGFAANDPESTEMIWRMALEKSPHVSRRIALINCRADRADRSLQFAEAILNWPLLDHVVLMGTGTYVFARAAVTRGFSYNNIFFADDQSVDEIFDTILGLSGGSALVVGVGNIGGQGLEVVQHFRNRSWFESEALSP